MISFKNNIKKSTLSFKVIVVCLLLSGSLITPGFAAPAPPVLTNGKYNCNTGVLEANQLVTTGYFTIANDVVTGNTACTGAVIIPNGVTSIGNSAFLDNSLLTSVTIPDSVTSIGNSAFGGNTALTTVTIPNSVTSIGTGAFYYDIALVSVTIGNSVTSIGNDAFGLNSKLTSVTFLGTAPPTVGVNAFLNVANKARAIVATEETTFGLHGSTWNNLRVFDPGKPCYTLTGDELTYGTYCTGEFTIPNSVTSIGNSAFLENTLLTSVTIPDSVLSIGDYAFYGNTSLTSVTIGNSVDAIGESVFDGNTLLGSVTFLGNAPTSVGPNVFQNVAAGATANVPYNATGFPADGSTWNGLIVTYASAPPVDADSSSPTTVVIFTPAVVKTADAVFNLKDRKYLSKNAMKINLRKNMIFERDPKDSFKYSIFKTSKKTCIMRGNYVMGLKKTDACEMWVTRTTAKGAKYKYWVKINYSK